MSAYQSDANAGCADCGPRSLEADYAAFEDALPRLLDEHLGRYALIANGRVLDIADTFTAACHSGYDSGLGKDFLVLKIAQHQGIRTSLILS